MGTAFKQVKNNATARTLAEISAAAVSVTLKSGQGAAFPSSGSFWITLYGDTVDVGNEIVLCTSKTSDVLTITRAQQGTSAAAWPADSKVAMLVTEDHFEEVHTAINAIENGTAALAGLDVNGSADISVDLDVHGDLTVDGSIVGGVSLDTVDINGGTIDGTTIGGTLAAPGDFSTLGCAGQVDFDGTVNINATGGLDIKPGSDIDSDLITVGVTGAPVLSWDESQDRFDFSKGIQVGSSGGTSFFGGNLSIGTGATSDDITIAAASPIIYFGDASTDGSWRLYLTGGTLKSQKRISGTWTDTAILP